MNINLQQLVTFCTVINEGSMTAAASKLYLTQPAVSQQIRTLEEHFGTPLLDRSSKKIKPSLQGQLLFDYAKRILQMTQKAQMAVQTISQRMSGHYSIATTNSIGLFMLSPIVGLFLLHNDQLHLRLNYGPPNTCIEKLKNQNVDLAILPDLSKEFPEIHLPGYGSQLIIKDHMWLTCSGKLTGLPKEIQFYELNKKPLVFYSEAYPSFKRQFIKLYQKHSLEFKPIFESDNVGTLKRAIEAGLGWGFLPSHSVEKQIRSGRLLKLDVSDFSYSMELKLYYKANEKCQKMAEIFYRALTQKVQKSLMA